MKVRESVYFLGEIITIIAVIAIVVFYGMKNRISDVKNVKKTEVTMENIKEIRIALEKYYKLTGNYPNLVQQGANNNLKMLDFLNSDGEKISFAEIYGKNNLEPTLSINGSVESNVVYDVQNFKDGNFKGGWNFNYTGNNGEIHANLPLDAYGQ
ncbi:MAG: hypothetical protein ACRCZ9_04635, partial [Fusobacteriaceae bacterium]